MSKERETIIATTVATVLPCIVIGLCVPIMNSVAGIIAPNSIVATEAQSPLSSATPLAAASGAESELDLRLVFYGYPKIGVPQSGAAVITETGLSDVHDITFTRTGGED